MPVKQTTVAKLRKEHPKNVIALMGNHEDFTTTGEPNFNPCTLIDEAEAKRIVHSNIGYWAGYFEKGTIERVHEVFGSAHPVFGTSTPTSTEAFNMGLELGKSFKK